MNNETKKDYSKIPASAFNLVVGGFELGDNGDGAKTAPVRLVARSGKPIEHWFWGNVVHDLSGMQLHKSRLTIDYVHDEKEIVGYLNKFETETGDLIASGALVPFKDSDRATEIIHKVAAGVPYEASINFGGDGVKIEEVPEGFVTQVNGYEFEGPGMVIREWPLRGVAICPYGADMNTDSQLLSSGKNYKATVFSAPQTAKEDAHMNDANVENAAKVEAPEAAEELKVETPVVENKPVEELSEKPEGVEPEAVAEGVVEKPVSELSRDEFLKIVEEFGADTAAQVVKENGNYETALKFAYAKAQEQIAEMSGKISELSATKAGAPVPVSNATETKKSLFSTGK